MVRLELAQTLNNINRKFINRKGLIFLIREHPKLIIPPDHTVIWRYATFTEFMAMLAGEALFFCRLDQLHDQWEGVYPRGMLDWWAQKIGGDFLVQNQPSDLKSFLIEKVIPSHFINSWYISEFESDAMWRLYGHKSEGIAVKSTVGRLKRALRRGTEEIRIGKVEYIDYNQWTPPATIEEREISFPIQPFFWKRLGFQHENELRVLLRQDCTNENKNGINVTADLRELIDSVYLFPDSRDWFLRLTRTMLDKLGYGDLELKRSSLGERPWK